MLYSHQAYLSISTTHSGLCIAICSNTSADQAQTWGTGRCLLEKSQQGLIVYHGITSNQKKGGNLVQWRSSRQDLIAKSTCEADLIASSEALQQGENIAIVAAEMTNKSCDIEVSSDNAASLLMIRNGSEAAWRTRHISVKALWMHQMSRRGVKFTYQPTPEMAADSLTKRLAGYHRSEKTFVSSKASMSRSCSMWFHSMSFRDCPGILSTFLMSHLLTSNLSLNRSVRTVHSN